MKEGHSRRRQDRGEKRIHVSQEHAQHTACEHSVLRDSCSALGHEMAVQAVNGVNARTGDRVQMILYRGVAQSLIHTLHHAGTLPV